MFTACTLAKVNFKVQIVSVEPNQLFYPLCEYSHTKPESLAQIHTSIAEMQKFFYGIVLYWHTLYFMRLGIAHLTPLNNLNNMQIKSAITEKCFSDNNFEW